MNMGAYLLACFRRPEDSHDRNLGLFTQIENRCIIAKLGVIFGRGGLVVVYAVQPHSKDVHAGLFIVLALIGNEGREMLVLCSGSYRQEGSGKIKADLANSP